MMSRPLQLAAGEDNKCSGGHIFQPCSIYMHAMMKMVLAECQRRPRGRETFPDLSILLGFSHISEPLRG
jgi:hypothetical protein